MPVNVLLELRDCLSVGIRTQVCVSFDHVQAGVSKQVSNAVQGNSFDGHPRSIGVAQSVEYYFVPVVSDVLVEPDALDRTGIGATDPFHGFAFATGENEMAILYGPLFKSFSELGSHIKGAALVVFCHDCANETFIHVYMLAAQGCYFSKAHPGMQAHEGHGVGLQAACVTAVVLQSGVQGIEELVGFIKSQVAVPLIVSLGHGYILGGRGAIPEFPFNMLVVDAPDLTENVGDGCRGVFLKHFSFEFFQVEGLDIGQKDVSEAGLDVFVVAVFFGRNCFAVFAENEMGITKFFPGIIKGDVCSGDGRRQVIAAHLPDTFSAYLRCVCCRVPFGQGSYLFLFARVIDFISDIKSTVRFAPVTFGCVFIKEYTSHVFYFDQICHFGVPFLAPLAYFWPLFASSGVTESYRKLLVSACTLGVCDRQGSVVTCAICGGHRFLILVPQVRFLPGSP